MQAIIEDRGNGLPLPGAYCQGDGRIESIGCIRPHERVRAGTADWAYAEVSEADWDDCDEADEHSARVELLRDQEDCQS